MPLHPAYHRCFLLGLFLAFAASIPASAAIVINEIHYNPDVKTEPVEFIELVNAGSETVDLSGWYLSGGVNFTFPPATSLPAGGYVVVAQNPAAVRSKFGASALGPWSGTLNNNGEKIVLRDALGQLQDEVEYQLGFPWPTVGDPPGYSIELVNPAFDNNLGGNWRASVVGNPSQQSRTLLPDHAAWKYFKGFSEASVPTTSWRALNFDDSGWLTGAAPIGYDPSLVMGTYLNDMRSNYTTVFFRAKFVVTNRAEIVGLTLEAPANWTAAPPSPGSATGGVRDRDGDGMPDDWEQTYALNPDNPADAAVDSDGDGLTNLQEYLSGTNPRDASSRLKFDLVTASGGTVTLRFTAAANQSYTIQYRDDLASGGWQDLTNVLAGAATRVAYVPDPAGGGTRERFYRLVTPLTP